MKKIRRDEEEQELLESFDCGEWRSGRNRSRMLAWQCVYSYCASKSA